MATLAKISQARGINPHDLPPMPLVHSFGILWENAYHATYQPHLDHRRRTDRGRTGGKADGAYLVHLLRVQVRWLPVPERRHQRGGRPNGPNFMGRGRMKFFKAINSTQGEVGGEVDSILVALPIIPIAGRYDA